MGHTSTRMSRTFVALLVVAVLSLCLASEVEDLGAQPVKQAPTLGEAAKTKARTRAGVGSFTGALMTSGSFTMMAASGLGEEERRKERDHSMGKCVKFASDSKCSPQCYHQGKAVDETEE